MVSAPFRKILSVFGFFLILGIQPAWAQTLFQNNNVACESQLVLCDTDSGIGCLTDVVSVACKNISGGADFNGDGFIDCVASSPTTTGQTLNASVLINRGTAATNCSSGTGDQFQDTVDYNFFAFAIPTTLGSVVAGPIDNTNFDDFAIPSVSGPAINNIVASAFSLSTGGFGLDDTSIPPAQSSSAIWDPVLGTKTGFDPNVVDRSMALFDCDGDGDLDDVVTGQVKVDFGGNRSFTGSINVLRNDGTGLVDIDDPGLPGDVADTANEVALVPFAGDLSASLAIGDFDNANGLDVAVAVSNTVTSGGFPVGNSSIFLCLNNGSCGFPTNCTEIANLDALHGGTDPSPFSIAAGDFDGDGNADLVVSEPGLVIGNKGVHYFLGDGAGNFPTNFHVFYNTPTTGNPRVLTTGCFNNDNREDVAVSYSPGTFTGNPNGVNVGLFFLDQTGALSGTTILHPPGSTGDANGVDAADFDNLGGDDLLLIASEFIVGPAFRNAYVFMNSLETFTANAGPDQTVDANTPIILSGTCTASPDDPADPAEFDVLWTVSPSSGVTLTDATTLTPTFTAADPGTYTLTLACTSRCTTTVTDDVLIDVPFPTIIRTQGGCIANQLMPDGKVDGKWMYGLLAMIPVMFLFRRLRRKHSLLIVLILSILLSSSVSHALTKSFSVNTFEPTIDDSEFFTVYASPTMLKRNYHVGFYLDIAGDPYEFGDNNFNRVGGIVDNLLTGNVVGSYAVLDWLSVGVLVPVHFWEGIRSPNLALDENNFALGDVQLVLKLRLVDREKHHIGIAVVPFAIFPTSTNSTDFLGNGSFNGGGKVVIDARIKERVSIALNLGYVMRSNITDVGGNNLDDQFLTSLGISVDILKNKLKVITEGQMATVAKDFFGSRRTTPAEARIGFRYTFANNHDINAGAGFGLSNGIGSPAWRGFIGYTYTKRPIAEVTEAPPPVSDINVGDELTLADKIYFEFDKAVIRDISKPTLDKIAGFLKAHPEVTKIKIDGHTCDLGSLKYNQGLSERRAKAVATYLEGQGISADRIGTVEGFGETKPLVPNSDEAHREQNRRVQIFVEAVAGK